MIYTKFEQLTQRIAERTVKARCAIVAPEDDHTIDAVIRAYREGIIEPILIGNKVIIGEMLAERYFDEHQITIIDERNHLAACQIAVDLANKGGADCIMKGLVHTKDFMHTILKRENQLKTGQLVSMLSIRELPFYHKLIAFTDAGICMYPTLDEKRQIIENAVKALRAMGYDTPKVGVLAAVEVVNPKMQESVDADSLKRMNQEGIIKDCIVEGPISYDVAVSKEAAAIKGFDSPVAGDADLLVFPDLVSANCTTKAITQTCHIPVGSLILGTKVPVILSSRASMAETKYMCIALAAAAKES
ncbi:MAG: phosphate acyltransferase [Anaerovoracaceae bacterium]